MHTIHNQLKGKGNFGEIATDGIPIKNFLREMQVFNLRNPNADAFAWERHVSLAFDSMSCKGRFVVHYHTNEIIGMATDCLKPSAILNELKELEACHKSGKQVEGGGDEKAEPPLPELTKHFLIFAATTWSPKSQAGRKSKHQFICVRYGLKSTDSAFLIPTICKIILYLSYCGFIVNTIVEDGASDPNIQQCREISSKISGQGITHNHLFNFSSGANTAGIKREHDVYLEPVPTYKKYR